MRTPTRPAPRYTNVINILGIVREPDMWRLITSAPSLKRPAGSGGGKQSPLPPHPTLCLFLCLLRQAEDFSYWRKLDDAAAEHAARWVCVARVGFT